MKRQNRKVLWAEMRRGEIEQAAQQGFVVLVPVGSIEQHGPHLPLDTDTHQAFHVAVQVATQMDRVLVAPPVWWGFSPEHMGFSGTISLRIDTLLNLLRDICDCIVHHGFKKIVLLNGHGSNAPLVNLVVNDFARRHSIPIAAATYWDFAKERIDSIRKSRIGGMGHACELETSLQMLLRPELVDMAEASAEYIDRRSNSGISAGVRDMFDTGIVSVGRDRKRTNPTGIMGDPTVASAETGRQLMAVVVQELITFLREYQTSEFH